MVELTVDFDGARTLSGSATTLSIDILLRLGARQPLSDDMRAPRRLVRDVSAAIGRDHILDLQVGSARASRAVDGNHATGCCQLRSVTITAHQRYLFPVR